MKRIIFITVLCFLAAVLGYAQADLQPAATVNLIRTEAITVRQLRAEVERAEINTTQMQQYRALYAQRLGRQPTDGEFSQFIRREMLDTMINERLALQAAERDRIIVSENEVNQQMQQFRSSLAQQLNRQPTDAEFAQAVRESRGMDVPAFREEARRQMIVQKYLMAKKGDKINSINRPTDAEITAEYNMSRAEFVRPETVRFNMIQVPYGTDSASRTRARELANRLLQEIGSNPSKFDEVATRSAAPNSGYQAGDAGYLPRNQQARELVGQNLMNAVFSLRQGEVSGLIEGVQGFQIIKVTENYDFKNLELDDIILGSSVTVRNYIGQAMLVQRQQITLAQATQELVTELRTGRSFQIFENNLNW